MGPLVLCQESVRCPDCERMTVPKVDVLTLEDGAVRHDVCPEPSNLAGHISAGGAPTTGAVDDVPPDSEMPSSPSPGSGAFLLGEAA